MTLTRKIALALIAAGIAALGGCSGEDCTQMTDRGSIGRQIDLWRTEDRIASESLKPEFMSWWEKERARWPTFKKSCVDSSSCYDKDVADQATFSAK